MDSHNHCGWRLTADGHSEEKRFSSCAAVAVLFFATACALPLSRDAGYATLVSEFQRAARLEQAATGNERGARFQVGRTNVVVTVIAPSYPGVVSLKYSDEAQARELYTYVDYSLPVAIRRSGEILYVHWEETLIRTVHRVLAFDLSARREILRRRVDPRDLGGG